MAWTDEMVAELKRLWAEGVTTGEIGRRLNISKNSIVGKVHRLGLSGRPSPIKRKNGDSPVKKSTTESKKQPQKKEKTQPKISKPAKSVESEKVEKEEKHSEITTKQEVPYTARKTEPKQTITTSSAPDDEADIKLAQSLNVTESKNKNTEALHLTDLDNHTCRWPIGDPKDENFHFCGKKVKMGQTYCDEHAAIAYVKPSKK